MRELVEIQTALKAPKNQYNSFGKYNYRNCDDILEAVKPLLKKYDCYITINASIELIGERYYVKSIATITNDKGNKVEATAYAREPESKKGMDSMQITGATSSYANKYALNGLLAIDDTKDADSDDGGSDNDNNEQSGGEQEISKWFTEEQYSKAIASDNWKKIEATIKEYSNPPLGIKTAWKNQLQARVNYLKQKDLLNTRI